MLTKPKSKEFIEAEEAFKNNISVYFDADIKKKSLIMYVCRYFYSKRMMTLVGAEW